MKKNLKFIALLVCLTFQLSAQRRTIVVPAPQPPDVPIDGGIIALLIYGGIHGRKLVFKNPNL